MSDPAGAFDRLVEALGGGDREEAVACFAPGASVVLSGAHHDYSSYPPERVIDGLLRAFMEVSWTPSARRVIGGANVDEGVLTATHIGPFLGVDPSAEQVSASVRVSYTVQDGRLEMLSVWGDRESVVGDLGAANAEAANAEATHSETAHPEAGEPGEAAEVGGAPLTARSGRARRRAARRGVAWSLWAFASGAMPGRRAGEGS